MRGTNFSVIVGPDVSNFAEQIGDIHSSLVASTIAVMELLSSSHAAKTSLLRNIASTTVLQHFCAASGVRLRIVAVGVLSMPREGGGLLDIQIGSRDAPVVLSCGLSALVPVAEKARLRKPSGRFLRHFLLDIDIDPRFV